MTVDKEGRYKPRFSFEVTEEQANRATRLFTTFGIRRAVMSVILDDLLDLIESQGQIVIGVILDGAAKPREIIKSLAKAERRSHDGV